MHQIEIVAALDEDRSGPDTGTDGGANRRAFAPAGDRPNHGTDRGANAGARHRASSLATLVLNPSLVVDPDGVIVRRPDAFDVPGEVSGAAFTLTDGVEFERHLGPARDLAGAADPCEVTVDDGPLVP